MAVCIFCQQDKVLTAEHVFPSWMTGLFPPGTGYTIALADSGFKEVIKFGGKSFNYTSRVVCRACNSGWMSTLEVEASRLLPPLIRSDPCQLVHEDLILLARWAVKTAIVSAYASRRVHPVAREHGQWLHRQQVPNGHTFVWLGTYAGRKTGSEQWRLLPRTLELRLAQPPNMTLRAYSWTAAFGRLLLKVVFLPPDLVDEHSLF